MIFPLQVQCRCCPSNTLDAGPLVQAVGSQDFQEVRQEEQRKVAWKVEGDFWKIEGHFKVVNIANRHFSIISH